MCYGTHTFSRRAKPWNNTKKTKKINLKVCGFSDSATTGLCFSALKVHCYFRLCPDLKKPKDDIKPNEKEKSYPGMKAN